MTASRPPILLVEDTPSLQTLYEAVLGSAGYEVRTAADAETGLAAFRALRHRIVVLDLMLPDRDGLDLMQDMLALAPETAVIVITSDGSISRAVQAMRGGAHEFLVKPFEESRLLGAIENALAAAAPEGAAALRSPGGPTGEFIGSSQPMREVYGMIRSVARSMATVFITGESGTGKELCARAVHGQSTRAGGPFVALDCGAIEPQLLDSEVFGHLSGSIAGAVSDKPGAAAAADGGTLFLDRICELDLNLQAKLLQFLQTATIQPIGAAMPRKVNTRIICATNRDPREAVRRREFREDLYYRLHVVPIHMPALHDRGKDIVEIAEAALARYSAEERRGFRSFDDEVKELFLRHPWPGNVRELLNVIRTIVVLNEGPRVTLGMLPADFHRETEGVAEEVVRERQPRFALDGLIGRPLAEIERLIIEETIARHDGSVTKAARVLDVAASTIYRKLDVWGRGKPAG